MSNSHKNGFMPKINALLTYLRTIEGLKICAIQKKGSLPDFEYYVFSAKLNSTCFVVTYSNAFGITIAYTTPVTIQERYDIRKVKKKLSEWSIFKQTNEISFCSEHKYLGCYCVNYSFGEDNLKFFLEEKYKIKFLANSDKAFGLF